MKPEDGTTRRYYAFSLQGGTRKIPKKLRSIRHGVYTSASYPSMQLGDYRPSFSKEDP